jgi:four helix bundle protein
MDSIEMSTRTKRFGLRIIKLVDALPDTITGRAIGSQIVRSGTGVGANYRSAIRGRSKKEFSAKVGVSLEECDETAYWLEMIVEGELLPENRISELLEEADELCKILYTTQRSSRKNDQ